ncbi:MAG: TIGR00730 family Rossman fold protein [Luteitalea sp.]|nr:TIGR00730 family Rossman fold protein [Luteitalea sp.]
MNRQPLAYLNPEFLETDEARPIRILSEYFEPLGRFEEEKIQDTVVFFGSARMRSRAFAERARDRLKAWQHARRVPSDSAQAALARAEQAVDWSRYYEDARELARLLTQWSRSLDFPYHRFVVCSGGGPGIMEAANRGAHEAGGKTIGLNIRLPFEQGSNRYITERLLFEFHYFFMRKFWFAYLAKALVIFPGGFGTFDELFEILALMQTRKLRKRVSVMLYGSDYWNTVVNFNAMVQHGAIAPGDVHLLTQVDDPREAYEILRTDLTKRHLVPAIDQEQRAPGIAKTRG